jgi:hypothetical protein
MDLEKVDAVDSEPLQALLCFKHNALRAGISADSPALVPFETAFRRNCDFFTPPLADRASDDLFRFSEPVNGSSVDEIYSKFERPQDGEQGLFFIRATPRPAPGYPGTLHKPRNLKTRFAEQYLLSHKPSLMTK